MRRAVSAVHGHGGLRTPPYSRADQPCGAERITIIACPPGQDRPARALHPVALAIAQVTPFAWEVAGEVNQYVARVSGELAAAGPSGPDRRPVAVQRRWSATRAGRCAPTPRSCSRATGPRVLGVGEVLPFSPTRRRAASLPVDVARTIEAALGALPLDVVNVHEPFAPSASSSALRHSRALNVGSFHAPTERILSTQLTAPLSRLLFARLDARTASYVATRNLLQRYFPGEYRVITPGADPAPERAAADAPRLVMIAGEERARGAHLPARPAPAAHRCALDTRPWSRGGPPPRRPRSDGPCASASRSSTETRAATPRCWPAPTSRSWPRRETGRRPGRWCARSGPERGRRLAPARLRRGPGRRRARLHVRARRGRDAGQPSHPPGHRPVPARAQRGPRGQARAPPSAGSAWPTSSRRSTASWPPAATTSAATGACAPGSIPAADRCRPAHAHRSLL